MNQCEARKNLSWWSACYITSEGLSSHTQNPHKKQRIAVQLNSSAGDSGWMPVGGSLNSSMAAWLNQWPTGSVRTLASKIMWRIIGKDAQHWPLASRCAHMHAHIHTYTQRCTHEHIPYTNLKWRVSKISGTNETSDLCYISSWMLITYLDFFS